MSVRIGRIHHFAVMAPAAIVEQTMLFYTNVLGLRIGFRPQFSVPGYWLYSDKEVVIHLTANDSRQPGVSGYLHHIALECDEIQSVITCLEEAGIQYRRNDLNEILVQQVLLKDPAGNAIEIVCTPSTKQTTHIYAE